MLNRKLMVHEPTSLPFTQNTVTEISVPSGKLISHDSLGTSARFQLAPTHNINHGIGQDALSRDYSEQLNAAYAGVQNTSPHIMRQSDGNSLVVASMPIPEWDEEDEAWVNAEPEMELYDGETIVAEVTTGLWAVKLTDYQNWLDNGGKPIEELNSPRFEEYFLIDVIPGRYRWTAYCHNDYFDFYSDSRMNYAKLELIESYV